MKFVLYWPCLRFLVSHLPYRRKKLLKPHPCLSGYDPSVCDWVGFIFLFLCFTCCASATSNSFVYEYNVPSQVTLDFRKSYSVDIGSVKLLNKTDEIQKFRYIKNSPLGYFFNRKTKEIKNLTLVPHSSAPEKEDSLFWALLGSGTWHTPVQPRSSITLTLYLNMNFHHQPQEIINYVIKNHKDLEYHIFNPIDFPASGTKAKKPPTVLISSFSVILPD